MAQLLLSNRPGATDEVLAVLEDGVHPGRKVVQDPRVWNSRPLPKFRSVHVPGEPVASFDDLMEPDIDATDPDNPVDLGFRRQVIDTRTLAPTQAEDLSRDRTIILTPAEVVRRRRP